MKNQKISSGGACKIYRDSVIQLSIQYFMGIEIAKLELMPEAVYLFDKMNTRYYYLAYEQLSDLTGVPLTYSDFQALVSNQFFTLGSAKDENFNKVTSGKDGKNEVLTYVTDNAVQKTFFDGANITKVEVIGTKNKFNFTADYGDFKQSGDVTAPKIINLTFKSGANNIKFNLNIEKVEFNKELKIILTNPLRYSKGDLKSFFENLTF